VTAILTSKFWVLAIAGVGLWATSTHAQNDGPVADDKENHRGTPGQIRARWRAADKALAASTRVKDNQPTDCDDAWESASEYVLGE
jgi:hypothetical protein